jgi:aminoglycoside 3-N-acetyltransferase I
MDLTENPEIIQLGQNDVSLFRQLIDLFAEVFEAKPGTGTSDPYLTAVLSNPFFVTFAATVNEAVVGGVTGYILPQYNGECAELFIYDIAVKTEFQRAFIGTRLLAAIDRYCKDNGIELFFVAANEEDQHAVDFYHRAGGSAERVVHFNFEVEG